MTAVTVLLAVAIRIDDHSPTATLRAARSVLAEGLFVAVDVDERVEAELARRLELVQIEIERRLQVSS